MDDQLPDLREEWRGLVWEAAVKGGSQGVLPVDVRRRVDDLFDRVAACSSVDRNRLSTRSRDAMLALGALLIAEHGESCDCDTCLANQPIYGRLDG